MPDFDPYHMWLGISPAEQPPSHYRLLGINEYESNQLVIQYAADQRMTHLRTLQAGQHANEAAQLLNEVSLARVVLLNPNKKQQYDQTQRAQQAATANPAAAISPVNPASQWQQPRAPIARPLPVAQAAPIPVAPVTAERPNFQTYAPHFSSHGSAHRKRQTPPSNAHAIQVLIGVIAALVLLVIVLKWGRPQRPEAQATSTLRKQPAPVVPAQPAQHAADETTTSTPDREPPKRQPPSTDAPTLPELKPDVANRPRQATIHPPVARGTDETPAASPDDQELTQEAPVLRNDMPAVPVKPLTAEEIGKLEASPKGELIDLVDPELQAVLESATTPESKVRAATTFLAAAERSDESRLRYALLKIARELGVSSGHADTTFATIDAAATEFEVDAVAMKLAAISTWSERMVEMYDDEELKTKLQEMARVISGLAEQAQFAGDRNAAARYYLAASEQFKNAGKSEDAKRMRDLAALCGLMESLTQQGEAALLQLQGHADDPAANLAAGKYLCLVQGEWQRGIARLAKGSDVGLKAVAAQELADPVTPDAMHEVGDLWWSQALHGNELEKPLYMARAADYYQRALPGLRPAIQKRVKVRLDTAKEQAVSVRNGRIVTKVKPFLVGQVWHGDFRWDVGYRPSYTIEITKRGTGAFEALYSWQNPDGSGSGNGQCVGSFQGNRVTWNTGGQKIVGKVVDGKTIEFEQWDANGAHGQGVLKLAETPRLDVGSNAGPQDPVGVYRMIYTGDGHGTSTVELTANRRMIQGNDKASWAADGSSVVIRYDNEEWGQTTLHWLDGRTLVGINVFRNGAVFNWVMKRIEQ